MIYDFPEDVEAWLDDVKGTRTGIESFSYGRMVSWSWKLKKDLTQPSLEIIFEHALVTSRKILSNLQRGAEFQASFLMRKDGTHDLL